MVTCSGDMQRKMSNNSVGFSSTESDDSSSMTDGSSINLHLIAHPGNRVEIFEAYHSLLTLLDAELNLLCVSEKATHTSTVNLNNTPNEDLIPSLAIIMFFKQTIDDVSNSNSMSVSPNHRQGICKYRFNRDQNKRRIQRKNRNGESLKNGSLDINSNKKKDSLEQMGIFIIDEDSSDDDSASLTSSSNLSPLDEAKEQLQTHPWSFHHEERPRRLLTCPENKQDYYSFCNHAHTKHAASVEDEYPLVGVRQMHYGRQVLRFTLFVESENWEEQVDFYKLILGKQMIMAKPDFYYFVVWSTAKTDVEFALKRLSFRQSTVGLRRTILQFDVQNLPMVVPLLPHECQPISKIRWQTRDYEGNLILLHVQTSANSPQTNDMLDIFARISLPKLDTSKQPVQESQSKNNEHHKTIPTTANNKEYSVSTLPKRKSKLTPRVEYFSDTEGAENKKRNALERSDSFEEPQLPKRMPLLKTNLYTDFSLKFPLKWGQTGSLPDVPLKRECCLREIKSEVAFDTSVVNKPSIVNGRTTPKPFSTPASTKHNQKQSSTPVEGAKSRHVTSSISEDDKELNNKFKTEYVGLPKKIQVKNDKNNIKIQTQKPKREELIKMDKKEVKLKKEKNNIIDVDEVEIYV